MKQGHGGFIVVSVLVLLIPALLFTAAAIVFAGRMAAMFAAESRAMSERRHAVRQALQPETERVGAPLCCAEGEASESAPRLRRRLCGLCEPANPAAQPLLTSENREGYPLINYRSIFRSVSDCALQPDDAVDRLRLSPAAVRSSQRCTLVSTLRTQGFVVRANLAARDSIELIAPGIETSILAAAGYAVIDGTLTIRGKAMVIAGGDLMLARLVLAGPEAAALLISATGTVRVGAVSGPARLRIIAWQGAELPPGLVLQPAAVLPPRLTVMPLYLERGEERQE